MRLLKYFKALGDETRLRLIGILLRHELNVGEIVDLLDMGQSRVSRHLKVLSDSNLLERRSDGLWVFYKAATGSEEANFLESMAPFIQELPEVSRDLARAERIKSRREEEKREFFDRIAPQWSALSHEIMADFPLQAEIGRRMPACALAADLGCGSGENIPTLLARAGKVIAVDASGEMLKLAGKRGENGNVETRLGNLEYLPLKDAEADFILMSMVMHHLSDPGKAVTEAFRTLKEGGKLLIADFALHTDESMRKRYGDRRLGFDGKEIEAMTGIAGFRLKGMDFFELASGLTLFIAELVKPPRLVFECRI